jgi:hypothetical protein
MIFKRAMECERGHGTSSVKGRRASLAGQSASKEVGDLPLVLFFILDFAQTQVTCLSWGVERRYLRATSLVSEL